MTMTRNRMVEHDTATFAVMREAWKAEEAIDAHRSNMHRAAGDKPQGHGRRTGWEMTFAQVTVELAALAVSGAEKIERTARRMLQADAELVERLGELSAALDRMDAIYQVQPWPRYYPCRNADGHIHSSLRDCQTVRWETDMGWATHMSGLTPDQAVHGVEGQLDGLGETLCSVCFPEAPAQWCRTRSEVTRAEREAARAAKNAARDGVLAVKNLSAGEQEQFSHLHRYDRPQTVTAAKALVRKAAETAVELEWLRSGDAIRAYNWEDAAQAAEALGRRTANVTGNLEAEMVTARIANKILIAREIAVPGTGWFQADADKAVAAAVKRARKAYFG